ncbi:MAG: hypothetical protein GY854_03940 [Deltaproteobacteria bacterium]|nr:hypothetical protein [Deltaproteobacteria bacterium]
MDDDLNQVVQEEISQDNIATLPPEAVTTPTESIIARELRLALDELEDKIMNEVAGIREMVFSLITARDDPTWISDIKERLEDTREQMKTMDEEISVGLNRLTEEVDRVNHSVKSVYDKIESRRYRQIDSYLADFLSEVEPSSKVLSRNAHRKGRYQSTVPPPKMDRS